MEIFTIRMKKAKLSKMQLDIGNEPYLSRTAIIPQPFADVNFSESVDFLRYEFLNV